MATVTIANIRLLFQGALNSLMGTGAVFGCLIAGWMSDRWGRRDSIAISALVFIVGGVLQCASQNIEMQLIGRFISGLSVGACSVLCKFAYHQFT